MISPSRTIPNSPPAQSQSAERMALPGEAPRRHDSRPTSSDLSSSRASKEARICHHRPTRKCRASLTPMVKKNSTINTSRKGLISFYTCSLYSVYDMRRENNDAHNRIFDLMETQQGEI